MSRDNCVRRYARLTANSLLIGAGQDPLAIAGTLGHADTRLMFERFGHLFGHSAGRVALTADRIFAALETDCRTIVVMKPIASASRACKNAQTPYRIDALAPWRGGDGGTQTPGPLHAKQKARET